jgi:NADH-quinone oxidoreductase subunit L
MFIAIAVLAPLAGCILAALLRPFAGRGVSVGASVLAMIVSAAAALASDFRHFSYNIPDHTVLLGSWISVGSFAPHWALAENPLVLVMVGMVSVVSALIHVYSMGYMADDATEPRFFVYISLFTFAMLMLVTATNLLQLFFGWEGVGLMSYLLIGYWYDRPAANAAAIKAFVVNRVADLFFTVGIVLTWLQFHSVSYAAIFAGAPAAVAAQYHLFGADLPVLEVISILLFIGAMGKSAQIFFHTWLPDAMEGPTPISALIHAATMVAAGVFLVVRMSPVISLAPTAMGLIAVIGGFTAFFAATIGCVQNDIKRIIAYSTCSQLGYMFLAAGVGANPIAIFHLINHAFFKALLFLAAGCVIHAVAGEQDIRKMGGLWRKLPVTYVCMWIGALALAAIPPFSGYYSKDAILSAAAASGTGPGIFGAILGTLGAGLTAFYIVRLILITFHGEWRGDAKTLAHVHEAPLSMTGPLIPLALGAFAGGFLLGPIFIGKHFARFWAGSIVLPPRIHAMTAFHHLSPWAAHLPLVASLIGIAIAYLFYVARPALPFAAARRAQPLYLFVFNKWYFDELYDALFVRPAFRLGRLIWHVADDQLIDGIPSGLTRLTTNASGQAVRLQTGSIAVYSFVMLIGLLALLSLFLILH